MQPVSCLQLSSVQGLLSLHTSVVPPLHWPFVQLSLVVQKLPSVQGFVLFL